MLTFVTVFRRLFIAKMVNHRILPKLSAIYHKRHSIHSAVFSFRVLSRLLLGPNANDVLSSFGDHISFEKMTPAAHSYLGYILSFKNVNYHDQIFSITITYVDLRLHMIFDSHSNSSLWYYNSKGRLCITMLRLIFL